MNGKPAKINAPDARTKCHQRKCQLATVAMAILHASFNPFLKERPSSSIWPGSLCYDADNRFGETFSSGNDAIITCQFTGFKWRLTHPFVPLFPFRSFFLPARTKPRPNCRNKMARKPSCISVPGPVSLSRLCNARVRACMRRYRCTCTGELSNSERNDPGTEPLIGTKRGPGSVCFCRSSRVGSMDVCWFTVDLPSLSRISQRVAEKVFLE